MYTKSLIIIYLAVIGVFSQDIIEEIDTIDMTTPSSQEGVNVQEIDTAVIASPPVLEEKHVPQIDTIDSAVPVPIRQEMVQLQETIPEAPTRPIAQTVIGAVLTGSGGLLLILDLVLIGLENAAYGEVQSQDKPMIIIYAIAGGSELIAGISLLASAKPKWDAYNAWEKKHKNTSMTKLHLGIAFDF